MLNLGTGEVFVILVVALLVLGPDKLPSTARQVGRFVGELRRVSAGFQAEVRDAIKEPVDMTPAVKPGDPGATVVPDPNAPAMDAAAVDPVDGPDPH